MTYNFVDGADFSNNRIDDRTEFSLDWLTTFAGRAGMDFDGWLVYGKAGVAVADVSAKSSSSYVVDSNVGGGGLLGLPSGTYSSNSATNVLRLGPVIGFGVEKKLTENVSLGLEYNYVHLGDVDVATGGFGLFGGGGGTETFSANMHSVKAALNYHF